MWPLQESHFLPSPTLTGSNHLFNPCNCCKVNIAPQIQQQLCLSPQPLSPTHHAAATSSKVTTTGLPYVQRLQMTKDRMWPEEASRLHWELLGHILDARRGQSSP